MSGQRIETASWAYGNSGTRFKVFQQEGAPRDAFERIEDAAVVHRLTGIAPAVALHIPWDKVSDYAALSEHARQNGISIGAINPNLFEDEDFALGSLANPRPEVRRKAVEKVLECIEIAKVTGSTVISLWLADGTNYPGQDDIVDRQDRLTDGLRAIYAALPSGMRLLLEYKFFEPGFYTTDLPDWGTAFVQCLHLGPAAHVLVDIGHHAPGTNIEFIVATLMRHGRLGGFHFNSRFYADDDLMAGAADPFQLFRIMREVVSGDAAGGHIAFMLDQSHNIEAKIPAQIRSVMNIQEATAKALLIDSERLSEAQRAGDVLGANAVLMDAYDTDVRPLLSSLRQEMGLDPDPVKAYERSGYAEMVRSERGESRSGRRLPNGREAAESATTASSQAEVKRNATKKSPDDV